MSAGGIKIYDVREVYIQHQRDEINGTFIEECMDYMVDGHACTAGSLVYWASERKRQARFVRLLYYCACMLPPDKPIELVAHDSIRC